MQWDLGKAVSSWHLLHLIHEIRSLVKLFDVSFYFVTWDRNVWVDSLAKCGALMPDIFKGSSLLSEVRSWAVVLVVF